MSYAKGFGGRDFYIRYFIYVKVFSSLFILARTKPNAFDDLVSEFTHHHFCFSLLVISKSMGFPGGSNGKESACNERDQGSVPGSGRFPTRRRA